MRGSGVEYAEAPAESKDEIYAATNSFRRNGGSKQDQSLTKIDDDRSIGGLGITSLRSSTTAGHTVPHQLGQRPPTQSFAVCSSPVDRHRDVVCLRRSRLPACRCITVIRIMALIFHDSLDCKAARFTPT